MSCCAADGALMQAAEIDAAARPVGPDTAMVQFVLPGMTCGACVAALERGMARVPGVVSARANLGARRLTLAFRGAEVVASDLARAVEGLGYDCHPAETAGGAEAAIEADLLARLGVAGFAAMNVMLLSVAVWAGADGATRDLLHWVSALIAGPATIYCGVPFYAAAWAGLRRGRLVMEAPIALALLGALGLSLAETMLHGPVAFWDAAVSLVFLLLVGRYLDRRMRGRARGAAAALARLQPGGARVLGPAGAVWTPLADIRPGDPVAVAAGERVAVDGVVLEGAALVDVSAVTGEAAPEAVGVGCDLRAGALALDGALTLRTTAVGADSSLGVVQRLMAEAESRKSGLAQLADRAAAVYAPAIHLVALAALMTHLALGAGWREAVTVAIATLIVTCPCALGLAAPMAQMVAAGALFARGILLKDGGALERMGTIRRAVFDKTGTLTLGHAPVRAPEAPHPVLIAAISLAAASRHPRARALVDWGRAQGFAPGPVTGVREVAGQGVGGRVAGRPARLGSAEWVGVPQAGEDSAVWFAWGDAAPVMFAFDDDLRPGAARAVADLRARGIAVEILSGDRPGPVAAVARRLGIATWRAGVPPEGKIAHLRGLEGVLMVGDGINDAPALAEASVSMAPASASDLGRAAADMVFLGTDLGAVVAARDMGVRLRRVVLQNFALAAVYNLAALPLAVTGGVTPLIAAIAMSTSSLLVVANALRLGRAGGGA